MFGDLLLLCMLVCMVYFPFFVFWPKFYKEKSKLSRAGIGFASIIFFFVAFGLFHDANRYSENEKKNLVVEKENRGVPKVNLSAKPKPAPKIEVNIDISVEKLKDNRVIVKGKTNLPKSTYLMIGVRPKSGVGPAPQDKVIVKKGGTFSSQELGPENGLAGGIYFAEVTMPIPAVQNPGVRKIIGENGENLTGDLVENGALGISVSSEIEFKMGSTPVEDTKNKKREANAKIVALKKEVSSMLKELLSFKDKANFKKFGFGVGGPYNKWMKDIQRLHNSQPVGLNHEVPLQLRAAPGDLMQIGLDYLQGETKYIKRMLPELKKTIEYQKYSK